MRAEARRFERAWAAHEQVGEAATRDAPTLQLVALAEGLRALAAEGEPAPVERAWAKLAEEIDRPLLPLGRPARPIVLKPRRPHRRAFVRAIAAAAALFAAVASMSLRAHPGSFLYPLRTGLEQTAVFFDGSLHLRIANARLGDLVGALEHGPQGDAPHLAGALMAERSAATRSGQDVSSLDAAIRAEVPPALAGVSAPIARQVEAALGSLLPATGGTPASSPSATTPDGGEQGSGGPTVGDEHSSSGSNRPIGSGYDGGGDGSGDHGSGGTPGSRDTGSGDGGGSGDTSPASGDPGSGSGDGGSGDGTTTGGSGTGDAGPSGTGSGADGSDTAPSGSGPGTSADSSAGGSADSGSTNPDSGTGDGATSGSD